MHEGPKLALATVGPEDKEAEANAAWLDGHLGPCIALYMTREHVDESGWRGQPLSPAEVAGFRRAVDEGSSSSTTTF